MVVWETTVVRRSYRGVETGERVVLLLDPAGDEEGLRDFSNLIYAVVGGRQAR
jgi:hypothetical protein